MMESLQATPEHEPMTISARLRVRRTRDEARLSQPDPFSLRGAERGKLKKRGREVTLPANYEPTKSVGRTDFQCPPVDVLLASHRERKAIRHDFSSSLKDDPQDDWGRPRIGADGKLSYFTLYEVEPIYSSIGDRAAQARTTSFVPRGPYQSPWEAAACPQPKPPAARLATQAQRKRAWRSCGGGGEDGLPTAGGTAAAVAAAAAAAAPGAATPGSVPSATDDGRRRRNSVETTYMGDSSSPRGQEQRQGGPWGAQLLRAAGGRTDSASTSSRPLLGPDIPVLRLSALRSCEEDGHRPPSSSTRTKSLRDSSTRGAGASRRHTGYSSRSTAPSPAVPSSQASRRASAGVGALSSSRTAGKGTARSRGSSRTGRSSATTEGGERGGCSAVLSAQGAMGRGDTGVMTGLVGRLLGR